MTHDAAGNMTNDGGQTLTYDAENRLVTASGVTYTYDGDGKRVKKSSGKLYWTGTGADALTETDLSGTPTAEYIFFNGKRIARLDLPTPVVHYYFSDHLGTHSVVTSATGATIEQESDHYPYGGERVLTAGPNNYKFTGKERDGESGLDYFGARYYDANVARFSTTDPSTRSVDLTVPGSLNRYNYALNNPLVYVDPNGQWWTSIHEIILSVAFPGLSSSQLNVLKQANHHMDFKEGGQKPENSHRHAMCAPAQPMTACAQMIAAEVETHQSNAQNALEGGKLTRTALWNFGLGAHVLADMGSDQHLKADGTPRIWDTKFLVVAGHLASEGYISNTDYYGIGQSIRNVLAYAYVTFGTDIFKQMTGTQHLDAAVRNAVSAMVNAMFADRRMKDGVRTGSQVAEDAARLCALGNRAAC